MAKKMRGCRITLRLDRGVYSFLCELAEDLGFGPNALT